MSIEAHLHALAHHVRNLLGYNGVSLFLGCPDPTLCHPLLMMATPHYDYSLHCYGSLAHANLLCKEHVGALCDIAIQTGRIWCSDHLTGQQAKRASTAIIAAPLEHSGAVLGLLLCTAPCSNAFAYENCRLLEQYLPGIVQRVEEVVRTSLSYTSDDASRTMTTTVQEQSEFISVVCHDLRAPLTAIKGYIGLLQMYGSHVQRDTGMVSLTTTRQQQYLASVMDQANHLEVLIGDLLDMARIQTGQLSLRCSLFDLAEICQRVVQLMQYRIDQQEAGRYTLHCRIDPELPWVWADPDRVQQVLTNLLENAVKYSPDGGPVEILVHARRPLHAVSLYAFATQDDVPFSQGMPRTLSEHSPLMTYITVCDRGVGISTQQQRSLFLPFTRLEYPSMANVAGAGLGLYISRKLVEAMGGQVILKSSEGKGTSVTFTLPTKPLLKTQSTSFSQTRNCLSTSPECLA